MLSLEPRVLLDAAAATTAADTQTDVNEQSEAYEQSQQDFTNQQDNTESDISALALPSTTQTEATTKHWDLINAGHIIQSYLKHNYMPPILSLPWLVFVVY